MKKIKKILILIWAPLIINSCHDSYDCDQNFVKEYNNQFGHYFGFENRTVHEGYDNEKLLFKAAKDYEETKNIKLIFLSESSQLHFAKGINSDTKLYIKVGGKIDTVMQKFYKMEKKAKFVEITSYEIHADTLSRILADTYRKGGGFSLSNYEFTINDEIACSLKQLVAAKNIQH